MHVFQSRIPTQQLCILDVKVSGVQKNVIVRTPDRCATSNRPLIENVIDNVFNCIPNLGHHTPAKGPGLLAFCGAPRPIIAVLLLARSLRGAFMRHLGPYRLFRLSGQHLERMQRRTTIATGQLVPVLAAQNQHRFGAAITTGRDLPGTHAHSPSISL